MAIDLTSVKAQIADIKRGLFYSEVDDELLNNRLNFYRYADKLGFISSGWFMPTYPEVELTGQPYYRLSISDNESNREEVNAIDFSTLITFGILVGVMGKMYAIADVEIPKGATKVYYLKITPTGELEPSS